MAFSERARANLARHSPRIAVPRIFAGLSSTSVLTQERVEGDTIAGLCRKARALPDPAAAEAALARPRAAFREVGDVLGGGHKI